MVEVSPGDTVGRYVVEAHLGRGGMASVYRVRHLGLGSAHALKVLELPHASIRSRLMLEGRVQAGLAHPNIVAVTDLLEVGGAPCLILEYIAGPALDVWLETNRPDAALADRLFRGILDAVEHAHLQGLVHRDLKPGNVLLQTVGDRLVPKVADFGLVKLLGDDAEPSHTRTGFAMGTPGYMAPEQIRNAKDADARADIFALGCILYELWCGRRPFVGTSVYDVLVAIERRDHPAPRALNPELPAGVEAAILACLEPEREDRPATAAAVRALLDADAPPAGRPTPRPASPYPILSSPVSTLSPAASGDTLAAPTPAPAPPDSLRPAPTPAPAPPDSLRPAPTPAPPPPDSLRPAPTPAPPPPDSLRPAPARRSGGAGTWIIIVVAVLAGVAVLAAIGFFAFVALLGGMAGLADTGF